MRRSLMSLLLVTPLLLTACGGGSDEAASGGGGGDAAGEVTELTIGTIANADVAPIYLGDQQGFFADRGLELTFVQAQGGAAIVPAIVSGEEQFGTTNMTSLLQANARGLDLKLVAAGSGSSGKPGEDFAAVVVAADSPIKEPKDLAGKTVAINTINNISDTVTREAVRQDGGDAASVEFVELALPDMAAAVEGGDVDAAFLIEPFLSAGTGQGLRPVAWPYAVTAPNLSVAGWFTSQEYIDENPDVVKRFQEAIQESAQYARDNPDAVRAIIPTYSKISAEAIADATLPQYQTEINRESVQKLLDLGTSDGIIKGDVDVDAVILDQ